MQWLQIGIFAGSALRQRRCALVCECMGECTLKEQILFDLSLKLTNQ